ncbi:MAG: phosphopantetheine-binding protein, partial [Cyanobacteria bacterium P01_F01_bin.4]
FYPCYGMAEATLMISGSERERAPAEIAVSLSALENHQVVEVADATKGANTARRIIGCGQGWLDQSIQIVDPQTYIPRIVDQVGEIWVSGTSIAQGYWQQPEATQATFRGYLANSDRKPFLRTGDLGFIHKGELFITGRLKDMIIIRGRNHYPQDIEATVQQSHPALIPNACAAFGVEIEGHERLAIAQEVASPDTLDLAEVAKVIRQQIYQRHGLPTYGIVLLAMGSLPKTASQKIQRSACQKGFLAGTLDPLYEDTVPVVSAEVALSPVAREYSSLEAGTDNQPILQSWLVYRLAVALQQPAEQIDSTESFAIYGIDSSVAVSITSELSEWLHQDLDPMIFWEYPSIEKLSHYLSEECLASPITTTL